MKQVVNAGALEGVIARNEGNYEWKDLLEYRPLVASWLIFLQMISRGGSMVKNPSRAPLIPGVIINVAVWEVVLPGNMWNAAWKTPQCWSWLTKESTITLGNSLEARILWCTLEVSCELFCSFWFAGWLMGQQIENLPFTWKCFLWCWHIATLRPCDHFAANWKRRTLGFFLCNWIL